MTLQLPHATAPCHLFVFSSCLCRKARSESLFTASLNSRGTDLHHIGVGEVPAPGIDLGRMESTVPKEMAGKSKGRQRKQLNQHNCANPLGTGTCPAWGHCFLSALQANPNPCAKTRHLGLPAQCYAASPKWVEIQGLSQPCCCGVWGALPARGFSAPAP